MTRRLVTAVAACIVLLTAILLVAHHAKAHQASLAEDAAASPAAMRRMELSGRPTMAPAPATAGEDGCPMAAASGFGTDLKGLEGLPDVVVIDSLARVYGPVEFTHRLHAEMSQLKGGCANCHHDPNLEQNVAGCDSCHATSVSSSTLTQPTLKGAFHRQCLGCHRNWAHENGCGFCHEERLGRAAGEEGTEANASPQLRNKRGVAVQPVMAYETTYESAPMVTFHHVDHAEKFGLSCNQCHSGDSCSDCHDKQIARRAADRHADCMSCHVEKDNCAFCHDNSARKVAYHDQRTAWCLEPYHEGVACRQCHGEANAFTKPSTDCRGCHSSFKGDEFDHTVTGVTLYGSHAHFACERCHESKRVGSPVSCSRCHPSSAISWPADLPGKRRGE